MPRNTVTDLLPPGCAILRQEQDRLEDNCSISGVATVAELKAIRVEDLTPHAHCCIDREHVCRVFK